MATVTFKFDHNPGYTPTLEVFREDTVVSLDSGVATETDADGFYTVDLDVGSYTGDVLAVITNPKGNGYGKVTSSSTCQLYDNPIQSAAEAAIVSQDVDRAASYRARAI